MFTGGTMVPFNQAGSTTCPVPLVLECRGEDMAPPFAPVYYQRIFGSLNDNPIGGSNLVAPWRLFALLSLQIGSFSLWRILVWRGSLAHLYH
jgi:hypothetical protein